MTDVRAHPPSGFQPVLFSTTVLPSPLTAPGSVLSPFLGWSLFQILNCWHQGTVEPLLLLNKRSFPSPVLCGALNQVRGLGSLSAPPAGPGEGQEAPLAGTAGLPLWVLQAPPHPILLGTFRAGEGSVFLRCLQLPQVLSCGEHLSCPDGPLGRKTFKMSQHLS